MSGLRVILRIILRCPVSLLRRHEGGLELTNSTDHMLVDKPYTIKLLSGGMGGRVPNPHTTHTTLLPATTPQEALRPLLELPLDSCKLKLEALNPKP